MSYSNLKIISQFTTGYGEKQCAAAFWNGELEDELRELGSLNFFGLMKKDSDREKVMEEVDKYRAKSIYRHSPEDCSDDCKARGEKIIINHVKVSFYCPRRIVSNGRLQYQYPPICYQCVKILYSPADINFVASEIVFAVCPHQKRLISATDSVCVLPN